MGKYDRYADRFVDILGFQTRYMDTQIGEKTVVLIHGFTGSVLVWKDLMPVLEPSYRVIALDLPNHGMTTKAETPFPHEFMIDFLQHFVTRLNLSQFTLVGHSLGGAVSLGFAERYPVAVESLVLVAPLLTSDLALPLRVATLPLVGELLYQVPKTAQALQQSFRNLTHHYHEYDHKELELYLDFYHDKNYKRSMLQALRAVGTLGGPKKSLQEFFAALIADAKSVQCRTLLVWGRQDTVNLFTTAELLTNRMSAVEFWAPDGCGHGPIWEHRDEFNRRVAGFLGGES